MKEGIKLTCDIIVRYLILIVTGILNVKIFYFFFSALTIYPVYFLLDLIFDVTLSANVLSVQNLPIEIIGPCIAGSAYYLLLILNLSTPKIKIWKRIFSLIFSFGLLLVINILRIFLLSILFISGSSFFDITHRLIWVVGSVVFVVGVWFITVKLFRIKEIPFYSDITSLLYHSKEHKKSERRKKH
jgi:exosortase/archaeosortase family protein